MNAILHKNKQFNNLAVALVIIAVTFAALSRLDFAGRTGHMDEYDYLFVGKLFADDLTWPTLSYIFGFDLNWRFFSLAERIEGSVYSARIASGVLGVISLLGMYFFTLQIWKNKNAAIIASVLLSLECAHIFSSKLVTYDIISVCFFLLALPCLHKACYTSRNSILWVATAAILLSLSVLSKYTTIILLPIIAIIAFSVNPKRSTIGGFIILAILGNYINQHFSELKTLYEVQIAGVHVANTDYLDVFYRVLNQQYILFLLAITSTIFIAKFSAKSLKSTFLLLLLSSIIIIYHIYAQNLISLYKHLIYSSIFIIPIISYSMALAYEKYTQSLIVTASICSLAIAYGTYNYFQLMEIENAYPDSSTTLNALKTIDKNDNIISENPYLFRYHFYDVIAQSEISETNWFDNNQDGKFEAEDIRQAIWDRKFKYVHLNDQVHPHENITYRHMLLDRGYKTIVHTPYHLSNKMTNNTVGANSIYMRNDNNTNWKKSAEISNE